MKIIIFSLLFAVNSWANSSTNLPMNPDQFLTLVEQLDGKYCCTAKLSECGISVSVTMCSDSPTICSDVRRYARQFMTQMVNYLGCE